MKYLFAFFFSLNYLFSFGQSKLTKLDEDYFFMTNDIQVLKFHQSNDTLFEYKCYADKPCFEIPRKHYKIYNFNQIGEKVIIRLEQLDTFSMTSVSYPTNRYTILVLRKQNLNQLVLVNQLFGLKKEDITTNFLDTFKVSKKFGFTYFSQTQYNNFKKLKTISNLKEVKFLEQKLEKKEYKNIANLYIKSHPFDPYALGLEAELSNQVCIANGFNPIGACLIVSKLKKE